MPASNLDRARVDYPAQLAAAQAQLAAAQATQFKAEADARRQRGLPKQATTQQDVDNAERRAALRGGPGGPGPGRRCARPNWCRSTSARPKRRCSSSRRRWRWPGRSLNRRELNLSLDQGHCAAGRLDHQAQRRAGQLCRRPGSRSSRSSRRRSGSPPTSRRSSSTACGRAQKVDISVDAYPDLEADRPCRQHPAGLGLALHGVPAGERHRQLRQDRAARAGEDRHRQRHGSRTCRCRSACPSMPTVRLTHRAGPMRSRQATRPPA